VPVGREFPVVRVGWWLRVARWVWMARVGRALRVVWWARAGRWLGVGQLEVGQLGVGWLGVGRSGPFNPGLCRMWTVRGSSRLVLRRWTPAVWR
jgi:hypothetical protein